MQAYGPGETAKAALDVVVVGAGIGGLCAALACRRGGHLVTVFEQAPVLGPVGAGITLAPNSTRGLFALGVRPWLEPYASRVQAVVRRRWQNGAVLGSYRLADDVEADYGFPYWHVHRADLHAALVGAALDPAGPGKPVTLRLGTRIEAVDASGRAPAVVVTADGARYPADIVVGADGIHSRIRDIVIGPDAPRCSGDVAYRTMLPMATIVARPKLREMFAAPVLNNWMGPGRHLVHYPVRADTILNVLAVVPGDAPIPESWSASASPRELTASFEGWDSRLLTLLRLAESVSRLALYDREPLASWVAGHVCLLGDACHAMLPYQAQGAGQAIEDAVALAAALVSVGDGDDIETALHAYEAERLPRASVIQAGSRSNGKLFHLPDGEAQRARDAALARGEGEFATFQQLWSSASHPLDFAEGNARSA